MSARSAPSSSLSPHKDLTPRRFNSSQASRQRLFGDYDGARQHSQSPTKRPNGYATPPLSGSGRGTPPPPGGAFAAYPGANGHGQAPGVGVPSTRYTDPRGPYSDAMLSELETQNDSQVFGLSSKVQKLKDVGFLLLECGWRLTGAAHSQDR
jgi:blocked-early-in-transport protein 1